MIREREEEWNGFLWWDYIKLIVLPLFRFKDNWFLNKNEDDGMKKTCYASS